MILQATLLFALPILTAPQNGDRPGEEQPPLPESLAIPAAPVLSPDQEAATFEVEPGFVVELVAAEPLVHDPVAITFDGEGRLWVVEMRGYMPDADGRGEHEPVGSVAVLTDTDGDGRMDERTVFVDQLVLPRAVAVTNGGALVIAPPHLVFYADDDGDGVADRSEIVDQGLNGLQNPEHAINGLLPTLDNFFQCANQPLRYRFRDGQWQRHTTGGGGQWGITKDELGRIFYNTNSDPLRADALPSHYLIRNKSLGRAPGGNQRVVHDMEVWPARINPGVNRGYQPQTLRDDFRLHRFTGACGPHVYRGHTFPAEFRGNAFVCEPCGNLVKRYRLAEDEHGRLRGENVVRGREFLTSTDERFRPVQLTGGPDGALYVVDLYRGLIQHRIYLTSFLRKQVEERGLAAPIGLGRIWRVRPADVEPQPPARFADASWTELAQWLGHPGGWWRDQAQRTIVEEGGGDPDALELTREAALEAGEPLGRVHALWALEGIDGLDPEFCARALRDPDPRVRLAAVRVAEPWLAVADSPLVAEVARVGREAEWTPLANTALLALGEARTAEADRAIAELLLADCAHGDRRGAALSGLGMRELEFTLALVEDERFGDERDGRAALLRSLGACVGRDGRGERLRELIERVDALPGEREWQAAALLDGILSARPKRPDGQPGRFVLPGAPRFVAESATPSAASGETPGARPDATREPEGDAAHGGAGGATAGSTTGAVPGADRAGPDADGSEVAGADGARAPALAERFAKLDDALAWPGRPGLDDFHVRPLTPEERASFERGRTTYRDVCAACHQPSGYGDPGKAPPLRGSKYALGPDDRMAEILLRGLVGRIEIDGGVWDMEMPAYAGSDQELADVMTYVRREWGHGVEPVRPETVARVRARVLGEKGPLRVEELSRWE